MKIKLITLTTLSSLFFNFSCLAQDTYQNLTFIKPYVKGEFGGQKLDSVKLNDKSAVFKHSPKYQSKINSFMGIGIGSYWSENFRTDLTFNYYILPEFNLKAKTIPGIRVSGDAKINLWSLMLNGYIEVFKTDLFQVYVGGGAGMAQLKAKANATIKVSDLKGDGDHEQIKVSDKSKASNNFTYSLTLGTSYSLTDSTNLDLSYSWRDFGKTSAKWREGEGDRYNIKGHHVTVGLRFNI